LSSRENADYLMRSAQQAGITDTRELANFMGQMQIESGGFNSMNENLRYSGSRLLEIFPGRNGMRAAEQANAIAAGGPEKIAEAIYGGPWGADKLGNTQEGDGWKYHGRGYVQLTGRDNYAIAGKALGLDLINHPELAADREVAAKIAIHYWQTRVVARGHQHDVTRACHDINNGKHGLAERKSAANIWEQKLSRGYEPGSPPAAHTQSSASSAALQSTRPHASELSHRSALKPGDRGTSVTELQRQLNALSYTDGKDRPLKVDGHFGPATARALQAFQYDHGLAPDGIAGPMTLSAMRDMQQPKEQTLPAPQINEAGHPGFDLFRQARTGIHRLDAQHGRAPDLHSDQISACLAVSAWCAGMDRIDHVALGTDASRIFAAQGALDSPFKRVAGVTTIEAFNTSIAQSTQDWSVAARARGDQDPLRDAQRLEPQLTQDVQPRELAAKPTQAPRL